jgi:hypothetical protein
MADTSVTASIHEAGALVIRKEARLLPCVEAEALFGPPRRGRVIACMSIQNAQPLIWLARSFSR